MNPRNPRLLDPISEGYLAYLADVGRKAPRTVIDVRCTLRRISQAMAAAHPGVALWKLTLEDYLHWLEQERAQGRRSSCLAKNLSHLRGLLDYAWRSGRAERNVLDGFQLQDDQGRRPPDVLSVEEAARLVAACPSDSVVQRRERLIVLLLYGCGLRTHELCALDIRDVNRERRELLIRHGKGDRQRVVPVPQAVFTELLAFLLERGAKRGALLRPAGRGRRMGARQVCEVVRRCAEAAKLPRLVTPKTLRHSYATHLMDRGVDLAIIASLMGHRSPAETGVYLHVLESKPRQAVDRLMKPPPKEREP